MEPLGIPSIRAVTEDQDSSLSRRGTWLQHHDTALLGFQEQLAGTRPLSQKFPRAGNYKENPYTSKQAITGEFMTLRTLAK